MLSYSLMFTFIFYALVSFVELIAWAFYMAGSPGFARFYFSTIGYWGCIVTYAVPWIFAAV
jgi:hypothetical protein